MKIAKETCYDCVFLEYIKLQKLLQANWFRLTL